MKKILFLCLTALLLVGCRTLADYKDNNENFDILTLFSSSSNSQDRLWVGTFQLAFNDLKNNIIKHNIKFVGEDETPDLKGLNNEEFNSSMLDDSSYYTSYGKTSLSEKEKIKKSHKGKI